MMLIPNSIFRRVLWYTISLGFAYTFFICALLIYEIPIIRDASSFFVDDSKVWNKTSYVTFAMFSFLFTALFYLPLSFISLRIKDGSSWKNNSHFLNHIGVVIPCHKSADEIGGVIKQVLKYIPPQNIIVCDNGNYHYPPDNTFEVVKSINSDIKYIFIKHGHKSRALWTGAHLLPSHCSYILHLDDDTLLSDTMVFDESHFSNQSNICAVAFIRSTNKTSTLTALADFWYKLTDHYGMTQAVLGTRPFVPGPAGLWKRDAFLNVFQDHPALPFGEDIFAGYTAINKGFGIAVERRCLVTTFSPPVLINFGFGKTREQGYGASSIWKQRAHRWTVSAFRVCGKSFYSFLTYNTKRGFLSNVAYRLYRLREYKIIFLQLLYIPILLILISKGLFYNILLLKLALLFWPLLRNCYVNYYCWYNEPLLQADLQTILLSPLFNMFLVFCGIYGRLLCLLWYLPEVPTNYGMLIKCTPKIHALDLTRKDDEPTSFIMFEMDGTSNIIYRNKIEGGIVIPMATPPTTIKEGGIITIDTTPPTIPAIITTASKCKKTPSIEICTTELTSLLDYSKQQKLYV